jgi:NAD(P)-dependent dehydrogenase (short-subunit alcohol dehydrogenase family)
MPTALVTGASRGIGKAIALALAEDGYDVAITARTVHEGDGVAPETGLRLAGSLDSTASAIRSFGRAAHPFVLDLLDLDSLAPCVDRVVEAFGGRLDVVVNNAIYTGASNLSLFADTPPGEIINRVSGNLTAQLLITRRALDHMLPAGVGTFVNITSAAGQHIPPKPVGEGGWALTYAATKAGFHRIADMVVVEYGSGGIRAFNVNPGFVATERVLAAPDLAHIASRGVSPSLIGRAVVQLLGDAAISNGAYIHAQDYVHADRPDR